MESRSSRYNLQKERIQKGVTKIRNLDRLMKCSMSYSRKLLIMKSFFVQIQCLISTSIQQEQTASIFVCLCYDICTFVFSYVCICICIYAYVRIIYKSCYTYEYCSILIPSEWSEQMKQRSQNWSLINANQQRLCAMFSNNKRNQRTKRNMKSRESTKEEKQKRILHARGRRFWENENSEIHDEWIERGLPIF